MPEPGQTIEKPNAETPEAHMARIMEMVDRAKELAMKSLDMLKAGLEMEPEEAGRQAEEKTQAYLTAFGAIWHLREAILGNKTTESTLGLIQTRMELFRTFEASVGPYMTSPESSIETVKKAIAKEREKIDGLFETIKTDLISN